MTDSRWIRSISRRLNIEVDQLSDPIRRRRFRLSVWCTVLPIGALAFAALQGDWSIYEARPVASQHRSFENDCGQCHSKHLQPLVALASRFGLSSTAHPSSVTDQDCQKCHPEDTYDHNPVMNEHTVDGCVACHNEHRGLDALSMVADANCTNCHDSMETTDGSLIFRTGIHSLDAHPEFALMDSPSETDSLTGHGVHTVAERDRDEWRDKSRLHFSHATHLASDGVLLPSNHSENRDGNQFRVLTCNDCHATDDHGEYMQPIAYEQHCKECHRLEVSESLLVGGELPHAAPELLVGILRERLVAYAHRHAAEVLAAPKTEQPLPGKAVVQQTTPKDEWEWAERKLSEGDTFRSVTNACMLCHEQDIGSTTVEIAALKIVASRVPKRWLPHSHFSHRRHETMDCAECHDGAHSSFSAADILMTSMDTCRRCHASRGSNDENRSVRSDCIQCHRYHKHFAGGESRK